VTVDRSFLMRINRRNLYTVPLPLTLGDWKESSSVDVELKKGKNTILFTLNSGNKGVTIRHFSLKPVDGNG
jgi:hypothetical protein